MIEIRKEEGKLGNIGKLKEIAEFLNMQECSHEIGRIEDRIKSQNANLIIPFVGEFSSGKTTLINALTESKMLETATKPTTATIYPIHFSQPDVKAVGIDSQGERIPLDIHNLKNSDLKEYQMVDIYDTNKNIPESTILVDTPGLNSNEKTHKRALMAFLPNADAVLLSIDVNKQFTSIDKEFMRTARLANKEVFIVLTMCDSQIDENISKTIDLLTQQYDIQRDHIVCTSAKDNNLSELLDLLKKMDKRKQVYICNASIGRLNFYVKQLKASIDNILEVSKEDLTLQKRLRHVEIEKSKLSNSLEKITNDLQDEFDLKCNKAINEFENLIYDKLETLVNSGNGNIDDEAFAYVNGTADMIENDFKLNISKILKSYSDKKIANQEDIENPLNNFETMSYSLQELAYDLDLKCAGHEYDSYIVKGIKYGGKAIKLLASSGTSAAADAAELSADAAKEIAEDSVKDMCLEIASNEGFLEVAIGFLTEHTMAKPQRRRMIHEYLDNKLIPQFRNNLKKMSDNILLDIKNALNFSVRQNLENKNSTLLQLKEEATNKHNEYKTYINTLNNYKSDIENNWL